MKNSNNIQHTDFHNHKKSYYVFKSNGFCPYAWKKILNMNMSLALLIWISLFGTLWAETDFPGLRRPPNSQIPNDEKSYLLEQLSNYIESQARRRFQQQQLQYLYHHKPYQKPQEITGNGFSYYVTPSPTVLNEQIPFAVSPSDPRYYQNTPKEFLTDKQNDDQITNDEYYEETEHMKNFPNSGELRQDVSNKYDGEYYIPPMHVNPKVTESKPSNSRESEKENRKILHQNANRNLNRNLNNNNNIDNNGKSSSGVFQKPLDIESAFGLYIVALIAGISAAFTIGLLAVGVFWFSLHKKAKLAADVDYPAYGVTGPNLNQYGKGSPNANVDKKLAQSAQMYHYQHQKQQIIAMENRPNNEMNGQRVQSDVESDEENEGDYTVYEYAGQGFTGEMEVKNPLFDPTPTGQTKTQATTESETTKKDANASDKK